MKLSIVTAIATALSLSALACSAPVDDDETATSGSAQTADFDSIATAIVAEKVDASGVDALASLFDDARLEGVAGSDSASERFTRVFQLTAQGMPFTYFGGGLRGQAGLHPHFQDGFLYEASWGGSTNQFGHFLTGVGLVRAGEVVHNAPGMALLLGAFTDDSSTMILKLMVGHELLPDNNDTSAPTNAGNQVAMGVPAALDTFLQAVDADRAGQLQQRDQLLLQVLSYGHNLPGHQYTAADAAACTPQTCQPGNCACPWGQGNSLNDLRLTLRAFRLGQKISRSTPFYNVTGNSVYDVQRPGVWRGNESPDRETPFATHAEVGTWLRQYLTSDY